MDALQGIDEPCARFGPQAPNTRVEVGLILRSMRFRFVQQDPLRPEESEIASGVRHLRPRLPNARVTPEYPGVVGAWLEHDIEAPLVRLLVEYPTLVLVVRERIVGTKREDFPVSLGMEGVAGIDGAALLSTSTTCCGRHGSQPERPGRPNVLRSRGSTRSSSRNDSQRTRRLVVSPGAG